jgi:hypothetical protein
MPCSGLCNQSFHLAFRRKCVPYAQQNREEHGFHESPPKGLKSHCQDEMQVVADALSLLANLFASLSQEVLT